ncbi:hypothetical protein A4249_01765 [Brevundimonas sp. GW460-12-10-14-LB2]|uniref:DUF3489 domain-containing protein n=1 Tax=Brevundimonas sp. GW460-12-10-14-LB2 TaxID=1827469 RepID=UPI0007BC9CAA|nr:DUF3489 domain-containing protein [Brevundimonas sp. GW460-12-10-14-LB2]ANC52519.1 hypothetical protein A4249_01765 [Brevundimonas sp. GW460-12-10-14-LB2]
MTDLNLTPAQEALIARLAGATDAGLAIKGPPRKSAAVLASLNLVEERDGVFHLTPTGRVGAGLPEGSDQQDDPASSPRPRAGAKAATVIEMLRRPEGATVNQISEATGWLPRSVRGFLAGALRKTYRLVVVSEPAEGGRVYRLPTQ